MNAHTILMVVVMALVTMFLRFVPFLAFGGKTETPKFIVYLGGVMPYAIMGMLVVYCLRNISFAAAPHGVPELLCCALVAGLHAWKRNTLLSIGAGTVCYMLLVQFVF